MTFKLGESGDCPLFDGLYDFCQIATGGSWDAAVLLAEREADVAINWAGAFIMQKNKKQQDFVT